MCHFALIPEAVEAVPTHMWVLPEHVTDSPSSRRALRAALRRAEKQVKRLRAELSPDV
jgi:hypothetical protein